MGEVDAGDGVVVSEDFKSKENALKEYLKGFQDALDEVQAPRKKGEKLHPEHILLTEAIRPLFDWVVPSDKFKVKEDRECNDKLELDTSRPDLVFLRNDNDKPYVLVEVKSPDIPPDPITQDGGAKNFYTGRGAEKIFEAFTDENIKQLWREYDEIVNNKKIPFEKKIEESSITARCGKDKVVTMTVVHSPDAGYGCTVKLTSESIEFYQLDGYLLNSHLTESLKYVIWTNGLCWRIFFQGKQLGEDIVLDPERLYVKMDKQGYPLNMPININPCEFEKLTRTLKDVYRRL